MKKKLTKTLDKPFYDPNKSYEYNYKNGPFGSFKNPEKIERVDKNGKPLKPKYEFFGHKLHLPFGIPAGPLVNAKFVEAAFNKGFDVCVYKTVRTKEYPCHKHPNVLAVHLKKLSPNRKKTLIADNKYTQPLSITNSFGVPCTDPKVWQKDMAKAVKSAGVGQALIGSFQGTTDESCSVEKYIKDFVLAAKMVKETGAKILEANLSCPNEGTANVLCFDTQRTKKIAKEIKKEIGKTPLILKLAYFEDDKKLENFVKELGPIVDGFSAINTIAAKIVDKNGKQALPGKGRERSGVCGSAITWAGLEMVEKLVSLRKKLKMQYKIIGVGGITTPKDFIKYQKNGADVMMSATGSMWNTNLAEEIQQLLNK